MAKTTKTTSDSDKATGKRTLIDPMAIRDIFAEMKRGR
jgi:hypothetical protein